MGASDNVVIGAAEQAWLDQGIDLLKREGMYLDLRRWDDWLALFDEEVEF
jgi:3-phenylpropionate/cinnamic acid dioxygenase small subunit